MPGGIAARTLGAGEGWRANEYACSFGPQDRPFEERHDWATVAIVLEGGFQYRGQAGQALLYPGALMLGVAGACYECGHDHGAGDRCVAFHFAPERFDEVAEGRRLPAPMLPASPGFAPAVVEAELRADGGAVGLEAFAIGLLDRALDAPGDARPAAPSARDERRVGEALRYAEANADRELPLAELAGVARTSRHHFLRTFRRLTGATPHQFVLGLRLRRAAARLRKTRDPVAAIAFEAGFGDLSTFNHRFRRVFGVAPTAFRRA